MEIMGDQDGDEKVKRGERVKSANKRIQVEIPDIQRKMFRKELLLFCILCLKK
jgi:hypothetical protein